jgi:hypothetical protein
MRPQIAVLWSLNAARASITPDGVAFPGSFQLGDDLALEVRVWESQHDELHGASGHVELQTTRRKPRTLDTPRQNGDDARSQAGMTVPVSASERLTPWVLVDFYALEIA